MTPTELLDDHARRPRHLGKLLNASAVGDCGSIVAGDAMRFYLSLSGEAGQERITAARFQVFNCQGQTGPASALAELVTGMPLVQAEELGVPDLLRHLGGLPVLELPPRVWAFDGLRAAAAVWRGTDLPADVELELPLLCRCLGIPEETVRQAIAVRGLSSIEQVVDATGAGSVCQSCRVDIPALLEEGQARPGRRGPGWARGQPHPADAEHPPLRREPGAAAAARQWRGSRAVGSARLDRAGAPPGTSGRG